MAPEKVSFMSQSDASNSSTDLEFVGKLGEEFIEQLRQGARPSIQEYIERYPEHATDIEELFPTLLLMEDLAPDGAESFGVATGPQAGPICQDAALRRLGDYRILREVGRGGMGIVYEAEQISLGRHVALKVLPAEFLGSSKQRSRFEREAKAAAKLHHTNIVPIFGVGEDEGQGYYVMQFIQGLPLDDVLRELKRIQKRPRADSGSINDGPLKAASANASATEMAKSLVSGEFVHEDDGARTIDDSDATLQLPRTNEHLLPGQELASGVPAGNSSAALSESSVRLPRQESGRSGSGNATYWQSVAHIGEQVASALAHAHGQGILHRDIKPANLLLDNAGTVWVTDFGLAKLDDERDLTQTGDVLGTLRYMPPESFRGKTDVRSEIYSLGLTLYEFLAFEPAFNQSERKALIDQVMHSSIEPLESCNAEIPRDLTTIVHKATEANPDHRYQTAEELREDLQRFLDDEPIRARRISTVERFSRWANRNRLLATLLTSVAFLLVAATIGSLLVASHFRQQELVQKNLANSNRRLADEKDRLAQARAEEAQRALDARAESDANLKQALKVVESYLDRVAEEKLLNVPGLQPLRKELLVDALRFYQSFAEQRSQDPELQLQLAQAFTRIGRHHG